jgi:hypothetical protein
VTRRAAAVPVESHELPAGHVRSVSVTVTMNDGTSALVVIGDCGRPITVTFDRYNRDDERITIAGVPLLLRLPPGTGLTDAAHSPYGRLF